MLIELEEKATTDIKLIIYQVSHIKYKIINDSRQKRHLDPRNIVLAIELIWIICGLIDRE